MEEPALEYELELSLILGLLYVGFGLSWNTYAEGMFVRTEKWLVWVGYGWPPVKLQYLEHR